MHEHPWERSWGFFVTSGPWMLGPDMTRGSPAAPVTWLWDLQQLPPLLEQ